MADSDQVIGCSTGEHAICNTISLRLPSHAITEAHLRIDVDKVIFIWKFIKGDLSFCTIAVPPRIHSCFTLMIAACSHDRHNIRLLAAALGVAARRHCISSTRPVPAVAILPASAGGASRSPARRSSTGATVISMGASPATLVCHALLLLLATPATPQYLPVFDADPFRWGGKDTFCIFRRAYFDRPDKYSY